jgi:hypothetical protein
VPVDELGEDDPMPDDAEGEEDWADDPTHESGEVNPDSVPSHWSREYAGFARNPVFVSHFVVISLSSKLIRNFQAILLCLGMLVFVRNRAKNALPLILGLFFKISGTSTRVT